MNADMRYCRETGDIEIAVTPQGSAEEAVFAVLADRKAQPVLTRYEEWNQVRFVLKLAKPPKLAERRGGAGSGRTPAKRGLTES